MTSYEIILNILFLSMFPRENRMIWFASDITTWLLVTLTSHIFHAYMQIETKQTFISPQNCSHCFISTYCPSYSIVQHNICNNNNNNSDDLLRVAISRSERIIRNTCFFPLNIWYPLRNVSLHRMSKNVIHLFISE